MVLSTLLEMRANTDSNFQYEKDNKDLNGGWRELAIIGNRRDDLALEI